MGNPANGRRYFSLDESDTRAILVVTAGRVAGVPCEDLGRQWEYTRRDAIADQARGLGDRCRWTELLDEALDYVTDLEVPDPITLAKCGRAIPDPAPWVNFQIIWADAQ